jgi:hypothetical protein
LAFENLKHLSLRKSAIRCHGTLQAAAAAACAKAKAFVVLRTGSVLLFDIQLVLKFIAI